MPARFHPHTHLHPLCRELTVKLLRFLTVLQSPLLQLPSLGIHKSNLLEARVVIASYNDHCSAPCLPSLFGWFAPPKFTRVREPTLSWNQFGNLKAGWGSNYQITKLPNYKMPPSPPSIPPTL